jgi:hypothetical protein
MRFRLAACQGMAPNIGHMLQCRTQCRFGRALADPGPALLFARLVAHCKQCIMLYQNTGANAIIDAPGKQPQSRRRPVPAGSCALCMLWSSTPTTASALQHALFLPAFFCLSGSICSKLSASARARLCRLCCATLATIPATGQCAQQSGAACLLVPFVALRSRTS